MRRPGSNATLAALRVAAMTATIIAAVVTTGSPAAAAATQPGDGQVVVHDFAFASGETMPSLTLHYRTLGTPSRNAAGDVTNAVLFLHGTTGSADTLLQRGFADALYGPGQPLDTATHFIVIPDGIGVGASSKPSDGLHARFPHYGYRDQVRAQHAILDAIGIKHLRLVIGTSMGGMQTWLWGETYPEDMDALVAVASTPAAITGRNLLWRDVIGEAIRRDPDWKGGDYPADTPPRTWIRTALPLFTIMTENAEQLQKKAPTRPDASTFLAGVEARGKAYDANDFLYTFESSADYDPAPQLDRITRPMLAINFADDLLNPPEMLNLPDRRDLTKVMRPGGAQSFGHQSLTHADLWAPALAAFLASVPPRY